MGLIYRVSDKEILKVRHDIFKEVGIPSLLKNRFELSPFKTAWHGEYDRSTRGYIYNFCRLSSEKYLEQISVYILGKSKWIQIYLNVYELSPSLSSLSLLKDSEGLEFETVSKISTRMRLRIGDYKGPPLLYILFLQEHKLGKFYTRKGYLNEILKLRKLIQKDMENIDGFVKRWHEKFIPSKTDWEGNFRN
ncbi:hypothetical protein HNP37_004716 [Flavobacterium nitrogenifigens]|uniref:Uncharacterized protein n=2 Tax=Flavobacterium TaxID=237 RepID=A0A7W7NAK7_9FLAO|nr:MULTISPECIES: hypothetical protein [Flavobacterium]MBB4804619.1 hypothetical protein [Flavobacterium nitrogenifigens]MBB6389578.1 hypothetical protein [Flavobacterium notoginsengisoli]